MSILINNVKLKGEKKDILIQGNRIKKIAENIEYKADNVIKGDGKVAIPSFCNAHTHAAMTLLRGYSDDLPVQKWLEDKIWPLEEKLTEEDVYWGAKLACLEMIKTGTTFFNDMYWHFHSTARAVDEMGIRAALSAVLIDMFDKEKSREQIDKNEKLYEEHTKYSDRIQFALGPHAIYTVSENSLRWAKKFADDRNLKIHIHLSESEDEVNDCLEKYGKRPVEYLDELGFLGENVITCHNLWLNDKEIKILKEHDVKLIHLPASNMKLSSGFFPYSKIKENDISFALGTDGCSSNNNLDMMEEMKIASMQAKINTMDPTALSAAEAFALATIKAAEIFGIDSGKIEEGKLADLLLLDLNRPEMTPDYNTISNIVYSANGCCVDTTICDGKILMQNGYVEGEEEIIKKVGEVASDLVNR